jgi:gliding motility-associated-like protein
MKRFVLFLFCLVFAAPYLRATHNIAGEITMTCMGGLTYKVRISTYTNALSSADRCDLTVFWGDSPTSSSIAPRINNVISNSSCYPSGMGDDLGPQGFTSTKENFYEATHTYPGAGTYTIFIKDPNRVLGITNIPNSVNQPFYLQSTIIIDPTIGCNSLPHLTSIPLDKACAGHCFYHNPGAVDPDGDSLSYRIGPCLDTLGNPIPGYTLPNVLGGGNLSIDAVTGDLSWCSPTAAGKYNVVIYIDEWKLFPNGHRYNIGTVLRDMSIDVMAHCSDQNPILPDLPDICVDANDSVQFNFTYTDPDASDLVKLEGYGGPFNILPSAILTPPSTVYNAIPNNATFKWVTNCDRVRLQPWVVTIKATDNSTPVALSDLKSFNITVVSPGPAFLNANPQGSQMNLSWGVNPCDPVPDYCKGYKIFRRQGPSGWNHAQCETGVPAYTGFVQIGTVLGIGNTTFIDDNNGNGLIPGVDYCYRVCAFFHDAAESYASPEACSELLRDVPVITNVDVMSTGNSNDIFVRWINAIPNGFDFDTIIHPGPWVLKLDRCQGTSFSQSASTNIATFTSNIFTQLQTTYVDAGINTAGSPWSYRLRFYGSNGNDTLGFCQPASSVFLHAQGSDNTVTLNWQCAVPWTNFEYAIYRFNNTTSLWDSIALAPAGNSYVDDSLENDVQYCYFITSHGSYFNPTLPPVMYNRSQETCATPHDSTPPCSPVLIVNSDCYIGMNQLAWTNPNHMNCGTDDVVTYNIYYSAVETDPLTLLQTINLSSDTSIIYNNLLSVAGCYQVTAVDTFGNESAASNLVCLDNCPEYILPNVFTPNGDGTNDFFIPFPYRYIKDVDVKIYDRWGVLIFETNDPNIHWDGRDMTSNKLCTDGVYYYTCTVNEIHLSGIVSRELKGFVHLFGKDVGQFH